MTENNSSVRHLPLWNFASFEFDVENTVEKSWEAEDLKRFGSTSGKKICYYLTSLNY